MNLRRREEYQASRLDSMSRMHAKAALTKGMDATFRIQGWRFDPL
jgi:hypothetical protein